MDWNLFLNQVAQYCIVPLLIVLTGFLVRLIQLKKTEIIKKIDNETANKYINLLANTIESCVIATNQTYVEALKKDNAFTAAAQKEAFDRTKNAVLDILSEDAKTYLANAFGDLNTYITSQIEATVNVNKK